MGEQGSRLDRFFMWLLFVLPATAGTLAWVLRDRLEPGLGVLVAIAGWGCAVLVALQIIVEHYRTPPKDR